MAEDNFNGCGARVRTVRRARAHAACGVLLLSLMASGAAYAQALPSPWSAANIGNPAIAGSAAVATACASVTTGCVGFSVTAAGTDTAGQTDQFFFVHRQLQGDGTLIARVRDLRNTNAWAKAGLMMRESLTPQSRHAFLFATPSSGVAFQRRVQTNGSAVQTSGSSKAPAVWLKIEREGTTLTGYESQDGAAWTRIGTDTLALGTTLYVGVAVTSRNPSAATVATVTDIAIIPPLPADWTLRDVGTTTPAGVAVYTDGAFAVAGGGADVWPQADQLAYLHRTVTGDVDLIARMTDLKQVNSLSKAGIMLRASLNTNAAQAFLFASGANGLTFKTRLLSGVLALDIASKKDAVPAWLKLERRGPVVTSFTSADGLQWTKLGTIAVDLPATAYVGMAVTSHDAARVASAVFDRVTVRELSGNNLRPTVTLTAPAAGAQFTSAPATVDLKATASDADGSIVNVDFYVGGTLVASDASPPYSAQLTNVAAGSYTVSAVAYDNRGEASVPATATFVVTAKPPTPPPPAPLPAGWWSSDVGGPAVAGTAAFSGTTVALKGGGTDIAGGSDQFRFVYGQITGDVDVIAKVLSLENMHAAAKAGVMIRGALSGSSAHGSMFLTPSQGTTFQRRTATDGASTNTTVTGAAPAWLKLERRGTLIKGYRSSDGTAWTLVGSDTVSLPADVYVGLAVSSHDASKAATAVFDAVTVRKVERVNEPPVVALVSPVPNGAAVNAPASLTLTATASDTDGSIARVDFYVGQTLVASDLSAPFTTTWSGTTAGSYAIKAVAYDSEGASATSSVVTIQLTLASQPPGKTTPTRLLFEPSPDHAFVDSYILEVSLAGLPWVTVAWRDVGKPPVIGGDCSVEINGILASLPRGLYVLQLRAVNAYGTSDGAKSTSFDW